MPRLRRSPILKDFQRYVSELEDERGFSHQGLIEKCLLLGEEVGELFKAVRKNVGLGVDRDSDTKEPGDEIVDVFIYLCAIANRLDVDLEQAFRDKEQINAQRTWE